MNAIFVFRKWKSKSYSVFSSLGKILKIGFLSTVYLTFVNPGVASTDADTTDVAKAYYLEEVDVDGEEPMNTYSTVSRVVEIVTAKEIQAAPVQTINEILEYSLGIDIRQRGVNNVQADISIRGGTFDQVLVLLNGVNITDPQTGHHNLNLPVDVSAIKQIEILKGPGSWRFGPGAYSGAINIITHDSGKSEVNASIIAGSYGLLNGNLSGSYNSTNTYHNISVNYAQSDGYIQNTDFKDLSMQYNNAIQLHNFQMKINLAMSDKNFGSNSFYTPSYPDQYESTRTYFTALHGEYSKSSSMVWNADVYWRRNSDRFKLFRYEPASWYTKHNYHFTDVYGANLLLRNKFDHSVITSGLNWRSENIWSNVLGNKNDVVKIHPDYDDAELDQFYNRSIYSAFSSYKLYWNNWTFNAGVNMSYSSAYNQFYFYPGIDLSYHLNHSSRLLFAINKSMRMPTFTDLFYSGPTNTGNSELEPEKSVGAEIAFRWSKPAFSFNSSFFIRKGIDMIDWIKYPEDEKWHTENLTTRYITGVELNTGLNFHELIDDNFPFQKLTLKYAFTQQSNKEEEFQSYYVMDYLKHFAIIGIHHRIVKNVFANWQFKFQDRNGTYTRYENESYGDEVPYDPFLTTDLKLYWKLDKIEVFTACTNLFNTKYFDHANVIQPGRWLSFGITSKLSRR